MPKMYAYNTSATQVKKRYAMIGSTATQVKKRYAMIGSTATLVYSAGVTLTNLIGSTSVSVSQTSDDVGYYGSTKTAKTISTISGHRYYVRAMWTGRARDYTGYTLSYNAAARFGGNDVVRYSTGTQFAVNSTQSQTGHAIFTATSTSVACNLQYAYSGCLYTLAQATFYMVVDLTELEAATGITYTAASFWSAIGSTVFYDTKEIEV